MDDCIAIVGMSSRFAGAGTLDEFWELLQSGKDSIRRGLAEGVESEDDLQAIDAFGVLEDIDRFDNRLFGITAREASALDPQQRIWLELVWHALEDAGLGERKDLTTGVFASANRSAYLENNIMTDAGLRHRLRAHVSSETRQIRNGNEREFLPLRTSFAFGFDGPSINIQTACSSALVAVASACDSLIRGETDVCIAGGISIARTSADPIHVEPDAIHSPGGQCRPFDAAADGTVFGDGGGVVVLRRMSDATKDRHRVYAAVRGWGITNDGGAKSSFAAPNPAAQARAIRKAWAKAGADVQAVSYVETHGTGTRLGDPIEFEGLTRAIGGGERRCWIGSVKPSIGHTDTAAGIAGFIKTALMLHRRMIVPTVGFQEANPLIALDRSRFRVANESLAWENDGEPRLAGVTALGVGGTNCHVALSESSQPSAAGGTSTREPSLLAVSAQSSAGLKMQVRSHADHLSGVHGSITDYCALAALGRRHLKHRVAAVGRDAVELSADLQRRAAGRSNALPARPGVLFAFTGQLSSYAGMARELFDREATFTRWINICGEILDPLLEVSLQTLLFAPGDHLESTRNEQPALCALQISLAEMWMKLGAQPSAVLGYSVGEIAAAHCAGVAPMEGLLRFAANRAAIMDNIKQPGFMMVAHAPHSAVAATINAAGADIAGIPGPNLCVISGKGSAEPVSLELARMGVSNRVLTERYGFHSSWLDDCLPALRSAAEAVCWSRPKIPYVSTSTGRIETTVTPDYWVAHARGPVNFGEALGNAIDAGCNLCLEIGPGKTLSTVAAQSGVELPWLSSLDPKHADWEVHLNGLASLYEAGAEIEWGSRFPEPPGWIDLPKIQFDRRSFWIGPLPKASSDACANSFQAEATWSADCPPYLSQHRLFGQVVVPASHQVAWVLNELTDHFGHAGFAVVDWVFLRPVTFSDDAELRAVLTLKPLSEDEDCDSWNLEACTDDTTGGGAFLTARLVPKTSAFPDDLNHASLDRAFLTSTSGADFYRDRWVNQDGTGPAFRRIEHIWSKENRAVAAIGRSGNSGNGMLDATIVEAGFQCLHAGTEIETFFDHAERRELWVPYCIDRMILRNHAPTDWKWCQAVHYADRRSKSSVVADISFYDGSGRCCVEISGFHLRPITESSLKNLPRDDATYTMELMPAPVQSNASSCVKAERIVISHGSCSTLRDQLISEANGLGPAKALDANDLENCARTFAEAKARAARLQVVYIEAHPPGADGTLESGFFDLIRTLGETAPDIDGFVISTTWQDGAASPGVAATEALARVAMNEYAYWNVTLVSHDANAEPAERARDIALEAAANDSGAHIVYREGQRSRIMLRRASLPDAPVRIRADRSYVIVGPRGAQTELLVHWLTSNGVGHVEVIAIEGHDTPSGADASNANGCAIFSRDPAKVLRERVYPYPIAGLFFLPWGTQDSLIELKSSRAFEAETADCARALQLLSAASTMPTLDHFVCFSSSAAVIGAQGQASYAALASYMDAICVGRKKSGLPGLSMNWPPWKDVGYWTETESGFEAVSSQGWRLLEPDAALDILGRAMATELPVVSILPVDWATLAASGFVSGLQLPQPDEPSTELKPARQSAVDELHALIREDISASPDSTTLVEIGLDSLMAVRLRNLIRKEYGTDIPLAKLLVSTSISDLKKLDATRHEHVATHE